MLLCFLYFLDKCYNDFNYSLRVCYLKLNSYKQSWIAVAITAGTNFDCATNPHPMDFVHEIRLWRMWILAGSIISLKQTTLEQADVHSCRHDEQRQKGEDHWPSTTHVHRLWSGLRNCREGPDEKLGKGRHGSTAVSLLEHSFQWHLFQDSMGKPVLKLKIVM